jgi:hypothetical protein
MHDSFENSRLSAVFILSGEPKAHAMIPFLLPVSTPACHFILPDILQHNQAEYDILQWQTDTKQ